MNELLHHYQIAVQHPGVSGFEVLEMLMVRDRLKEQVASLTLEQKAQLAMADQTLFAHLSDFYKELARITSLEYERQHRNPTPAQWWWYLDVLAYLPETGKHKIEPALADA
jgi:hypothetical protein